MNKSFILFITDAVKTSGKSVQMNNPLTFERKSIGDALKRLRMNYMVVSEVSYE